MPSALGLVLSYTPPLPIAPELHTVVMSDNLKSSFMNLNPIQWPHPQNLPTLPCHPSHLSHLCQGQDSILRTSLKQVSNPAVSDVMRGNLKLVAAFILGTLLLCFDSELTL